MRESVDIRDTYSSSKEAISLHSENNCSDRSIEGTVKFIFSFYDYDL